MTYSSKQTGALLATILLFAGIGVAVAADTPAASAPPAATTAQPATAAGKPMAPAMENRVAAPSKAESPDTAFRKLDAGGKGFVTKDDAKALSGFEKAFQDNDANVDKLVPEGIEGMVPFKGSVVQILFQLAGGVRSSMGYCGCRTIEEMRTRAEFVEITNAGMRESHVHDVQITKEAPNYRVE